MSIPVSIDVESNGPVVGRHSLVSLGAVVVEPGFQRKFKMEVAPIGPAYEPAALKVCGKTFAETEKFESPQIALLRFKKWLLSLGGKPVMWSDNPAYDWQWVNYYLLSYAGVNPLGHSARRIGDLYCGLVGDIGANREWKKFLRGTPHTHDPLDDAQGNAEALLAMFDAIKLGKNIREAHSIK